jgi:hypothetical protein
MQTCFLVLWQSKFHLAEDRHGSNEHTRMTREGAEACNKAIGLGSNETVCCWFL